MHSEKDKRTLRTRKRFLLRVRLGLSYIAPYTKTPCALHVDNTGKFRPVSTQSDCDSPIEMLAI